MTGGGYRERKSDTQKKSYDLLTTTAILIQCLTQMATKVRRIKFVPKDSRDNIMTQCSTNPWHAWIQAGICFLFYNIFFFYS